MRKHSNLSLGPLLMALLGLILVLGACGDSIATTSSGTTKPTIEAPKITTGAVTGNGTAASSQSAPGSVQPSPTSSSATGNQAASAPDAAAGGSEIAGTGDEPVLTYTNPNGQFSFQHAQSWGNTTKPPETIRFTGRDEFISISITSTNLSPVDFGKADAAALTAASPGFKGNALKTYPVVGTNGAMVSYTWQAGPSPVTGKMVPSSARRYYIPGAGGKMAVFTYSSPTNTYDPAGADDFANAFKWLK